jgi:phosphatidylserine/phosphatidylglycerophosphate/cardiolipin synthase-like enzyme
VRTPSPLPLTLAIVITILCGCCGAQRAADAPPTPDVVPDREIARTEGSVEAVLGRAYLPTLQAVLAGARESVRVVHFELNDDELGDAVVEALGAVANRGVEVRVLLEADVDANAARVVELEALGITAKLDTELRYTHAKLVVADGSTALLGSTNWSWMSVNKNNEADVLITDPALAGFFADVADALWDAPAERADPEAVVTANGVALASGDYVDHAMAIIGNALERVDLVVYGMNPNDRYPGSDVFLLIDALAAAQARGAAVRVVLEWADYGAGVNEVNTHAVEVLRSKGIAVRFDPPEIITHAKVLVADGSVIVGSNNWGFGGFSLYHEVGLRSTDPDLVAAMRDFADMVWDAGFEP